MTKDQLYYDGKPPETSGAYQVQAIVTGAAANTDWTSALGTSTPKGPVWLELTAVTQVAYVRFKSTNAAAGTTASNGAHIAAGTSKKFFVSPVKHKYIDAYAGGAGTLLVQVVSSPHGREDV